MSFIPGFFKNANIPQLTVTQLKDASEKLKAGELKVVDFEDPDKLGGPCDNCKRRESTTWWSQSTMDFVHGFKSAWCKICCLEKQLEHAEERAAAIPEIKRELEELRVLDDDSTAEPSDPVEHA